MDTSGETFLRGTQITDADGLAESEQSTPLVSRQDRSYPLQSIYQRTDSRNFNRCISPMTSPTPSTCRNPTLLGALAVRRMRAIGSPTTTQEYRTLLGQVTQDGEGTWFR